MKKKINLVMLVISFSMIFPGQILAQDDEFTCPTNSTLSGTDCICDAGYVSPSGQSGCVPESSACNAYGPSHLVGNDCVCNDGYAIIDGGICQSLSAACAQYDAVWSDAAGDCVCPSGWHEDSSANRCIIDEVKKEELKTEPATPKNLEPVEPIKLPNIPVEELPVITEIELLPIENDNTFKIIYESMQPIYNQYPEELKTFVIESKPKVEEMAQKPFEPVLDIYSMKFNTDLNFKAVVGETLPMVDEKTMATANQQMTTLGNFSDQGLNEQKIKSVSVIETMAENLTDQTYLQDLIKYHEQVKSVENEQKVKPGVDQEKYTAEAEIEERLKWQIATLEKVQRYSHMRIMEVTSHMRQLGPNRTEIVFEQMPSDYQEFFEGAGGSSDFEEANEGGEFNKAFANIVGANQQLKDLKATLKKNYPTGWKEQYLDLPAKPTRDETRQKIDKNLFLYMQGKMGN